MKTLTVFTPTYNRKHTLLRTYESLCRQTNKDFAWLVIDDGSSDGTRDWIESLGHIVVGLGQKYNRMGQPEDREDENHFEVQSPNVHIEYIYKPNGGLYTGYNVAYQTIQTELCVCIDSDDYMPDDAVEKILKLWKMHFPKGSLSNQKSELTGKEYGGILGLDFDINKMEPIGGFFPENLQECNMLELESARLHSGDTKQVMRTELMKNVAPMIGFEGEKNYNPFNMLMQVCDLYTLLVINDNLCTVEYQIGADSMSQGIFRQYMNSPKSYAQYRLNTMKLKHTTWRRKLQLCIHYISSCLIAKKKDLFCNNPYKVLTVLLYPLGALLSVYIKYQAKK